MLELNGRSVGLLQDYLVGDHPEYALLTAQPDAVGLDYLVGEPAGSVAASGPACCGRSCATWCARTTPTHRRTSRRRTTATPASLRVLDKLGFRRGLWFDEPQADGGVDTVVGCALDVRRVLA